MDPLESVTDLERDALSKYIVAMEALQRIKDNQVVSEAKKRCRDEKRTQVEILEATLDAMHTTCLAVPFDGKDVFVRKQATSSSKPVTAEAVEGALRSLSLSDLNDSHAVLSANADDSVPMVDVIEHAMLVKLRSMLTSKKYNVVVTDKPERGFQGNAQQVDDTIASLVQTYMECTAESKQIVQEVKVKQQQHEADVAEHKVAVAKMVSRVRPETNILDLQVVDAEAAPAQGTGSGDAAALAPADLDECSRPMYIKRTVQRKRPNLTLGNVKKNSLLKSAVPAALRDTTTPFSIQEYQSVTTQHEYIATFVGSFKTIAEEWLKTKEETIETAELLRGRKKRRVVADDAEEEN